MYEDAISRINLLLAYLSPTRLRSVNVPTCQGQVTDNMFQKQKSEVRGTYHMHNKYVRTGPTWNSSSFLGYENRYSRGLVSTQPLWYEGYIGRHIRRQYIESMSGRKRTYQGFRTRVVLAATALGSPISNGSLGLRSENGEMIGIISHNSLVREIS